MPSQSGHHEHQAKKAKTFEIHPKYFQIQAAVYLGSRQISIDAVSPLFKFECLATSINCELSFFKMPKQVDVLREELNISDLPSFARVCLNVIVLEENNLKNGKLRSGYLLGSVSFSIFDQDHVMRAGSQNLSLWPFQAFNPRLIC